MHLFKAIEVLSYGATSEPLKAAADMPTLKIIYEAISFSCPYASVSDDSL